MVKPSVFTNAPYTPWRALDTESRSPIEPGVVPVRMVGRRSCEFRRTLEELTPSLFQFQCTTMGRVTSENTNRVWRRGAIALWFQECIHNSQALGTRPADDKNEFGHDVFCGFCSGGFVDSRLKCPSGSVDIGLLLVGPVDASRTVLTPNTKGPVTGQPEDSII